MALGVLARLGVVEVVEQACERPALDVRIAAAETLGERFHDDLDSHAVVNQVALRDALLDERIIHAILGHADKAPRESDMDDALWCADPTTGFIVAAALVRPEKDLAGVTLKSLKKRWKESAFAKGASREQMAGCEKLGIERDEYLQLALDAMQARAAEVGL